MFGKKEARYDFRKRLTAKERLATSETTIVSDGEISLECGVEFFGEFGTALEYAKKDLLYFLGKKTKDGEKVKIKFTKSDSELSEFKDYKGRVISIESDGIYVNAFDDRGAAAAIYDLEKMMSVRKAPVLKCGVYKNKPLFSPRMMHSAYGLEEYPEDYLLKLVKDGIDSIVLFVKDINTTEVGTLDFNALIKLANEIGLDVYAYCLLNNFHHPDEENAEEIFDGIYGRFFRAHPGFKGLVLVGESIEFPSHDPKVCPRHYYESGSEDNIPDGRVSPGWWPCRDYPEWLSLLTKTVRRVKPDADIVFWTYNWGYAPEEDRIALINSLPTDITLQVTFEMFEKSEYFGVEEMVMDYTIAFPGPGKYYLSEAEAAKRRGIKLYSMSNTGGRTWDFGTLPYIPCIDLWKERLSEVRKSHFEHGLSGLMECHHYGYTPSFITRFAEYVLNYKEMDIDEALELAMYEFFGEEHREVRQALDIFSNAMRTYFTPTDEMQYGPMRIGTAYPLNLIKKLIPPEKEKTYFGLRICNTEFVPCDLGKFEPQSLRLNTEIRGIKKLKSETLEAISVINKIKNKNDELKRLHNMMKFIACCFETAKNSYEFYKWKMRLLTAENKRELAAAVSNIKRIGESEIKNAKRSIPFTECDSSIGYEPSMGYMCDRERIEWKIKQVRYMLEHELIKYERFI